MVNEVKCGSAAVYGQVIREIKLQISSFISCNLVHQFRSSNFDAHNLAKHALNLGVGRHDVWLGQPDGIPFVHVYIVTT